MTAVDWLYRWLNDNQEATIQEGLGAFEQAKQIEKQQIEKAMLHALDEDGHTGDWKIKFVNDYYNKTFQS